MGFENLVEYRKIENSNKMLKMEVSYDLGGYNRPRGYYATAREVEVEIMSGYKMEKTSLLDFKKYILVECARKSKKSFENATQIFEQNKNIIIENFENANGVKVLEKVAM